MGLSISPCEQRTETGRWEEIGGRKFIKINENRWQVVLRGWDYPFQPANSGPRRGGGRMKIGAKGSPGGAAGSFKLRTTHRE